MAVAASVNFQKITSTLHAIGHASREQPPSYLIGGLGSHVIKDDCGEVHKVDKHKRSIASRQAKASPDYSPLWEGVLNLPDKAHGEDASAYVERCKKIVLRWSDEYQKLTGHTVLRSDLHLDEGHKNEAGEVVLNAHAHIMADRTNEAGRVLKIDRAGMRKVQDMTAQVSQLERGRDARQTRLKHINSHQYKALAEDKRLESQQELKQAVEQARKEGYQQGYRDALAAAEAAYKQERERLKATREATQQQYQQLKAEFEKTKLELAKLKEPPKAQQQKVAATPTQVEAWRKCAKYVAGSEFILLTHLTEHPHDLAMAVRAAAEEVKSNEQSAEDFAEALLRHGVAALYQPHANPGGSAVRSKPQQYGPEGP